MTEQRRTREDMKKARASQKKKQKPPVMTWVKRIVLTIGLLGVLGLVTGAGFFAYYASKAPELNEELLKDPISSDILDKNGEVFATIGVDENRKYINYEDIPQQMVDAIIATEDARFFEHFGMDLWRLGGAVVANIRDGFGSQGASTITQQVVKNSFFSNAKTLERKAQEAWLAVQLERQYSKEEIFEMYFNKVLMSGTIYGFGTASEHFYGKELAELSLDEMAVLAGMPQSPNNYNPFKNPDRAQQRRDIVLGLMVQHKKITETEATQAKQVSVATSVLPEEQRRTSYASAYPAFLDVVLSELEVNGHADSLAEGIKVHTTLDPAAQQSVEDTMNNDANFPTDSIESGISVVDTKTGALVAVGGGRHYGNRELNYAYDLKTRSPGSTLKPIVSYGPAIEYLQWSTGETLVDEPMTYDGGKRINNWDGSYYGAITMREALYTSRNVPSVKTLKAVSLEQSQKFASKLGVDVDYLVESDALGGGRVFMSPIQLAAAYAAFGNAGVYHEGYSINKIEYRDGSTKSLKPEAVVAMSEATAYMVTDVLRDVVSTKANASGTAAAVSGVDIAGKTGTTNYGSDDFSKFNLPSDSVPDSWFVGYSTNYSIAVWSGYTQYSDPITSWDERRLPQKLFKSIMTDLSRNVTKSSFQKPSSVVEATIQIGSKPLKLASASTPSNLKSTELFIKGTVPTQVSTNPAKTGLAAPSNVQATYDANAQLINLAWAHNNLSSEEEPKSYTYEVTMKIDGGESTIIATTGSKSVTVPNVQLGSTYTFSVVAVSGKDRSQPGGVSIYIEGTPESEEPEEPEEPGIEEPESEDTEPIAPVEPPDNTNGNTTPTTPPTNGENNDENQTPSPSPSPTPSPTPSPDPGGNNNEPQQPEPPAIPPTEPTVTEPGNEDTVE